MTQEISNLQRWTELGSGLSGLDSQKLRDEMLLNLTNLEQRALAELNSGAESSQPVRALLEAIETAKSLCQSLLKPVDLSKL